MGVDVDVHIHVERVDGGKNLGGGERERVVGLQSRQYSFIHVLCASAECAVNDCGLVTYLGYSVYAPFTIGKSQPI